MEIIAFPELTHLERIKALDLANVAIGIPKLYWSDTPKLDRFLQFPGRMEWHQQKVALVGEPALSTNQTVARLPGKATKTFHGFKDLVTELKEKIWLLTLPAREIQVWECQTRKLIAVFETRVDETTGKKTSNHTLELVPRTEMVVVGASRPISMAVNKAAEREISRHYHPILRTQKKGKAFYFNPEIDWVGFGSGPFKFQRQPSMVLFESLDCKPDAALLRRISFRCSDFEDSFPWAIGNVEGMETLEELTIEADFQMENLSDPYSIKVEFHVQVEFPGKKEERKKLIPVFVYPDGNTRPVEFVDGKCGSYIVDPDMYFWDRERMNNLWNFMKKCLTRAKCLPKCFAVNFNYFPSGRTPGGICQRQV